MEVRLASPLANNTLPTHSYTEAIPLLYTHPAFHFARPVDFLAFFVSTLPQRLDLIRNISFPLGWIRNAPPPSFTYADLTSACTIRTKLPDIRGNVTDDQLVKHNWWFYKPAIWLTTGAAISTLQSLTKLTISVHAPGLYNRRARQEFLLWLRPIQEGGFDLCFRGYRVQRAQLTDLVWTWEFDEEDTGPWAGIDIHSIPDHTICESGGTRCISSIIIDGRRRR